MPCPVRQKVPRPAPPRRRRRRAARPGPAAALAAPLALLALFAAAGPAAAGAWLQEKGRGLTIVTGSFTAGTAAFNENGKLNPVPEYRKFELSTYNEFGITPWLTGILSGEMRTEATGGLVDQSTAAAAAGARVRILKRHNWMFSAQLIAETGDYDTIGLGTGSTEPGFDARLLAGYGFAVRGIPGYVDAQAAYRFRTGEGIDEGRFDLTLGVKPLPNWEFTLQSFNTVSLDTPNDAASYRYHKLRAAVKRELPGDFALEVGGTTLFFGENAIQEYGIDVSVWKRF